LTVAIALAVVCILVAALAWAGLGRPAVRDAKRESLHARADALSEALAGRLIELEPGQPAAPDALDLTAEQREPAAEE